MADETYDDLTRDLALLGRTVDPPAPTEHLATAVLDRIAVLPLPPPEPPPDPVARPCAGPARVAPPPDRGRRRRRPGRAARDPAGACGGRRLVRLRRRGRREKHSRPRAGLAPGRGPRKPHTVGGRERRRVHGVGADRARDARRGRGLGRWPDGVDVLVRRRRRRPSGPVRRSVRLGRPQARSRCRVRLRSRRDALWFEEPHEVVLLDPDGTRRTESARLAGHTLIWLEGDTTLRIEGELSLQRAVEIAESAEPVS